MYYNTLISTDSEEFLLSELIIELWRYRKGLIKEYSADHERRRFNFIQGIDDWSKREFPGYSREYTIVKFITEFYKDRIRKEE